MKATPTMIFATAHPKISFLTLNLNSYKTKKEIHMKQTALILTPGLMAIGLASCGRNAEAAYSTALDSAMAQVSYSDQAITGVTGNFDLITESISGNYAFTVTYTAGNLVEYPTGYTFISISDDGKQAVVTAPNFLDK